jgi:probable HAF family extracellular repeat protein
MGILDFSQARGSCGAVALMLAELFAAAAHAQVGSNTLYTLTDLGNLGGNTTSGNYAQGMNQVGEVTGNSLPSPSAAQAAFVWSVGVMTSIGNLGGGYSSGAAISIDGDVVGSSYPAGSTNAHAFYYGQAHDDMVDLGTLGGPTSTGTGINDNGQAVGFSDTAGSGAPHAFVAVVGEMTDLGAPLGGPASFAYGINNNGDIIGDADLANNGGHHAVIWSSTGTAMDLGDLGGTTNGDPSETFSYGYGINALREATGYSLSTAGFHAFQYVLSMFDLGTLGGNQSAGYGINDGGDVVGYSDIAGGTAGGITRHAFVAPLGGSMTDLNLLIDPDDPLKPYVTLTWATAINNLGFIIANGVDSRQGAGASANGGGKMYLLIPEAPSVVLSKLSLILNSVLNEVSGVITDLLSNGGKSPLKIQSIKVTGANAQEFNETNNCGATLAPGASCTISVTYDPTVTSAATAAVEIIDNAPGSPQSIALGGSVPPPDFGLTVAPNKLSGNTNQNLTASITVSPINNFSQPVSFTCGGLPAGGSCSFSPASVTPNAAPAISTLTIQTPSTLAAAMSIAGAMLWMPLLLTGSAFALRRRYRWCGPRIFMMLAGSVLVAGCGGSDSTPAAPITKTYNVVVTATSGNGSSGSAVITHTITIPLTLTS